MGKSICLTVDIINDIDLDTVVAESLELSVKIGLPVRFMYRGKICQVDKDSNTSMAEYQFDKYYDGALVIF